MKWFHAMPRLNLNQGRDQIAGHEAAIDKPVESGDDNA